MRAFALAVAVAASVVLAATVARVTGPEFWTEVEKLKFWRRS